MEHPTLVGDTLDHVRKQDDDSQGGDVTRSMDDLPEDICRRIHALMPLRDAARVSCASHTFLRSWRCYPNISLSQETLGLNGDTIEKGEMTRQLVSKVDHILKKHSGVGMKKLRLELIHCHKIDSFYINRWLHIAVTAGIEQLDIFLPHIHAEPFNFPCSLLFDGSDSPIRYLHIAICAFRPTAGLGSWRSLTGLYLTNVLIADDELECLLSSCSALECLRLLNCREIVTLKIPCVLKRLSFLIVSVCRNLQVIDSSAPNISTFHFSGSLVLISFRSAMQVKHVKMECLEFSQSNIVWHAPTKLLSYAPNVETLTISSRNEMISTPMLPRKFLHLKYLHICLFEDEAISPAYDYLSLVSFLEASPCLETFILEVRQPDMKHDSVIGDSSHLRQPQHRHEGLKSVAIVGFCSTKSLIELTCHIIESATSLEHLTLDTSHGCQSSRGCTIDEARRLYYTGSGTFKLARPGICLPMGRDILMEVPRAVLAIRTHIEGKVPPGVVFQVLEPCVRCHDAELLDA
uniref:Uncharacterized protein n=1 Tax=Avena sativa TaxID=4498 RepID=A0ACD5Y096_AVESA